MKKIIFLYFLVSSLPVFSAYVSRVRPSLVNPPKISSSAAVACQRMIPVFARQYAVYKNTSGKQLTDQQFKEVSTIEQKTLFPMCVQQGQCPIKNEMSVLQQKLHLEPDLKTVDAIYIPRTFYDLMILYMIGKQVKISRDITFNPEDLVKMVLKIVTKLQQNSVSVLAVINILVDIANETVLVSTHIINALTNRLLATKGIEGVIDYDELEKLLRETINTQSFAEETKTIEMPIDKYAQYLIKPLFNEVPLDIPKINNDENVQYLQHFVNDYIVKFFDDHKINPTNEIDLLKVIKDPSFMQFVKKGFGTPYAEEITVANITKMLNDEIKAHKAGSFMLFRGTADVEQFKPSRGCASLSLAASPFSGYFDRGFGGARFYDYLIKHKGGYMLPISVTDYTKELNQMFHIPELVPVASFFGRGELFHARTKTADIETRKGFAGAVSIPSFYETPPEQYKKIFPYIQKHHIRMGELGEVFGKEHHVMAKSLD